MTSSKSLLEVKTTKNTALKLIEIATLSIITLCYWAQYVFIGSISGKDQRNFIHYLALPLDTKIKFSVLWAPFYASALLIVPFTILLIMFLSKLDPVKVYRIITTCLLTLSIHYIIYLFLPSSTILWEQTHLLASLQAADSQTWLTKSATFILSLTSPWNSFPSFHVSSAWFTFRYLFETSKKSAACYFIWFIGMCIGALTLKTHIIIDAVVAILIAEVVYQLLRTTWSQQMIENYINKYSGKKLIFAYMVIGLFCLSFLIWEKNNITVLLALSNTPQALTQ